LLLNAHSFDFLNANLMTAAPILKCLLIFGLPAAPKILTGRFHLWFRNGREGFSCTAPDIQCRTEMR